MLRWRGGSGPIFYTFFEITVAPKVPPDKPIFWLGLEPRDPSAPTWRPRPFSRQVILIQKKHQNHDYGIIGILRAILAHNYQYFWYVSQINGSE